MINSVDLEVKTAQVYLLEYKGIFHFLLCIEIVLLFFSYRTNVGYLHRVFLWCLSSLSQNDPIFFFFFLFFFCRTGLACLGILFMEPFSVTPCVRPR